MILRYKAAIALAAIALAGLVAPEFDSSSKKELIAGDFPEAAILAPVQSPTDLTPQSRPVRELQRQADKRLRSNEARQITPDFEDPELEQQEIQPWISNAKAPVSEIYVLNGDETKVIENKNPARSAHPSILFLSSEARLHDYARQRAKNLAERSGAYAAQALESALPFDAYRVVDFKPGLRDDRVTPIRAPYDLVSAVKGPDYSFEAVDPEDDEKLATIKNKVVSFGHGGEMTIEVLGNGFIADEDGADFAIFENPFRLPSGKIQQELAQVGVATRIDGPYKWFPCDPKQKIFDGCAGRIPADEGGDLFDLADAGLTKARYIKIRDVGYNANSGENTEGFDLDALRLIHAHP